MQDPNQKIHLTAEIPPEIAGKRLDQALALLFPEHSRARLKLYIEQGEVQVNGTLKRPRDKVTLGDRVLLNAERAVVADWGAESIPLTIIYEDEHILVINKQANFVVHPAAGNHTGTLVNALLHYVPSVNQVPRAGVVHRLDKDTTGLMVIAKTLPAQVKLVSALQARTIQRIYKAVVCGLMPSGGTVEAPIARHPHERTRMAVVEAGKPATTHYRVIEKFKAHTHLRIQIETGRTHQIRVHMAHIHYPIVGDKTYGGRLRLPPKASVALQQCLKGFSRQALHASSLRLKHPITGEEMVWEVECPEDMQQLLSTLRTSAD